MLKNRQSNGGSSAGGGKAEWVELSSAVASSVLRRGIFIDIVGLEGQGKSSLALTLARLGKVAYLDIDQSVDRAKKPPKKQVERVKVLPVRYAVGHGEEQTKQICGAAWVDMESKVRKAAEDWAAGIVVDTATEDWELLRLGSFGTLTPRARRMDRLYGPVNAKYRNHLRSIYRTNRKHLITIHQLKDEYIDRKNSEGEFVSSRTGKHVRSGFKEIGYLTDMVVRCYREENEFKACIDLCKLPPNGPDLEGTVLEGEQVDILEILMLATGTEEGDWIK